jgi:hypothetical protein
MGRRLDPFERMMRDREREAERLRKAIAVKKRRVLEKTKKALAAQADQGKARALVGRYEAFVESLWSLHINGPSGETFSSEFEKGRAFTFTFSKPRPDKPQKGSFEFSYEKEEELNRLRKGERMGFATFCEKNGHLPYAPFIWFSGAQVNHEHFISEASRLVSLHDEPRAKQLDADRKEFDRLETEAIQHYESKLDSWQEERDEERQEAEKAFADLEKDRMTWFERAQAGSPKEISQLMELMFPLEFPYDEDFSVSDPSDADVGYRLLGDGTLELCIVVNELTYLPESRYVMKAGGRGYSEKGQQKGDQDQATKKVLASLAFAYARAIYQMVSAVKRIQVEICIPGVDSKGNAQDQVILKVEIDQETFNELNLAMIDPVKALKNFDSALALPTAEREIEEEINRDELVYTTPDDRDLDLSEDSRNAFREIFYGSSEIAETVVVHEGDLNLSDVTSPEGLELPDKVTGYLDLRGLTSAEGLKLPEHVGGYLNLPVLTSAEGLTLPEYVGGYLNLAGLESAEGLKLPEHMDGTLWLNGLRSAEGLKLPEHVGGTLYLATQFDADGRPPVLTSAEGLKLPEHVGGNLNLAFLTSGEGVTLPEHVGGYLDLGVLTSAEGLKLPEHVGAYLNLSGLESAEGLTLPEYVGEDIGLSSNIRFEYDQGVHGPSEYGEVTFVVPWKKR